MVKILDEKVSDWRVKLYDYIPPFFAVGGSTLFSRRYPASWL